MSGGVTGASAATLTFMVGAEDSEIFERSKVIIEGMGKNIYNCGKAGGGQIVKISNNLSLAIQMVGISESLAMA